MSSGLPINTSAQAKEYRNRYLAMLALEAQNNAYNLQANQVYKQTGQPSRPPDMRTTTEKLGDIEAIKVNLRRQLMGLTDGTQANEVLEQLTADEIIFTSQQIQRLINELKPRFAQGVPAPALLAFIRALKRKELQTNGVSYEAQEATAQQILQAIQNGRQQLGAPAGPFAPPAPEPIALPMPEPQPVAPEPEPFIPPPPRPRPGIPRPAPPAPRPEPIVEEAFIPPPPPRPIPNPPAQPVREVTQEQGSVLGQIKKDPRILQFNEDPEIQNNALNNVGVTSLDELMAFDDSNNQALGLYAGDQAFAIAYLKLWARQKQADKNSKMPFGRGWATTNNLGTLKQKLAQGFQQEELKRPEPSRKPEPLRRETTIDEMLRRAAEQRRKNIIEEESDVESVGGFGMYRQTQVQQPIVPSMMRKPLKPPSRYPQGRSILGFGLSKTKSSSKQNIMMNIDPYVGIEATPIYAQFGKYLIDKNKLASGILDLRTKHGTQLNKYKTKTLSVGLGKLMKRILGGRMPDEYDFNDLELDDQTYLWNLAKDSSIMDRLNLPTPKRSKESEDENRFNILRGQLLSGNDNKELVKEFKTMLLKLSNEGRIGKVEARELLLDLTALGH